MGRAIQCRGAVLRGALIGIFPRNSELDRFIPRAGHFSSIDLTATSDGFTTALKNNNSPLAKSEIRDGGATRLISR